MTRNMRAEKARSPLAWRNTAEENSAKLSTFEDSDPKLTGANSFVVKGAVTRNPPHASADQAAPKTGLSVRAENVLKELAVDLTGENPPQGRWIPSDLLVQRLTFKNLTTARNCGPQTTAEIIEWAQARGKIIQPALQARKSLSAMWDDTIAKFSAGEVSKDEVAEALEKSARRRNTRIPLAVQRMLLQLVKSSKE